jgi:hypothetical protein
MRASPSHWISRYSTGSQNTRRNAISHACVRAHTRARGETARGREAASSTCACLLVVASAHSCTHTRARAQVQTHCRRHARAHLQRLSEPHFVTDTPLSRAPGLGSLGPAGFTSDLYWLICEAYLRWRRRHARRYCCSAPTTTLGTASASSGRSSRVRLSRPWASTARPTPQSCASTMRGRGMPASTSSPFPGSTFSKVLSGIVFI